MPAAPRGHERLRGLISVKLMLTVNPASASLFSPEMVRKEEKEEDDAVAVSRVMMLRVCALEKREAHAVHAHSEAQGSHLHPSSLMLCPSRAHFIFRERSFGADMRRIAPFFIYI